MSLNAMKLMSRLVAYFDEHSKGYQATPSSLAGAKANEPLSHPIDLLITHFFKIIPKSSQVGKISWSKEGFLELPASFNLEEFKKNIEAIYRFVNDLRQGLVRNHLGVEHYQRVFDDISESLAGLLKVPGVDKNNTSFWQALESGRITEKEINTLRNWFDLVYRLKKKVDPFVHLFDFIALSGPHAASANTTLREAYIDSFLSRARTQPREYYELGAELIWGREFSEHFPNWQSFAEKYLSHSEKKALHDFYFEIMGQEYNDKFIRGCLEVVNLGIRAVFLEINSEESAELLHLSREAQEQAWSEKKARIFATYNSFAMLFAVYCPMKLVDFDQLFQKQFFSHFPMDHAVNQVSASFPSTTLRKEYVKFLLIQQIVSSAGLAFKDKQNLDLAVQYLSEHRTWIGKMAHKLFGYQTETHRIYETYQKTLDKDLSQEAKESLSQAITDQLRIKVGSLRKRLGMGAESIPLLEEKFPEQIKPHPQGVSFRRNSSSRVVHAF